MTPPSSTTPSAPGGSCLPILLVLLACGLLAVFPVQDFDLFWHLANGRAMVDRGGIVNEEIFSFTANGKQFSNHAWLAQIILWKIFAAWGANGLIAFKVMVATAVGGCLYLFCRRQGMEPLASALLWFWAFAASLFRYVERPELFSLLFLAALGALLFSYRAGRCPPWLLTLLPLMMGLWDCLHGALYGVILLGAFLLGETLRPCLPWSASPSIPVMGPRARRLLWGWVLVTCLVMWVSPYGLRSYDIFLEFLNKNLMTSMTAEFQPPTLTGKPLFWGLLAASLLTVLAAGRYLDFTSLVVLVPFAWLAGRYVRGIGPFCLIAVLVMGVNLPSRLAALPRRFAQVAGLCLLLLGMIGVGYYKFVPSDRYDTFALGLNEDGFPVGSARFVQAVHLTGNMYNTDRYGGYLAYTLFPERKIFHYNHHMLFTALERYVHEPESRAQWRINYAIIGRSDEWDMFSRDGFVPVYWEPSGAVMVRRAPENAPLIQRYAIRYFSPLMPREEFMRQAQNPAVLVTLARETSDYLAQRRDADKAAILAEMLLRQSVLTPEQCLGLLTPALIHNASSPSLAAALGVFSYRQGLLEPAERYLEQALRADSSLVEARFSLAFLRYDQQRFQEAVAHFEKILALTPQHPDSIYGLGLALAGLGRYPQARQAFIDYLRLAPQGPWAERARNFLSSSQVGS